MTAPDTIIAPWTSDQVDRLNRFQRLGYVHEFTCPDAHDGADRTLVATRAGWICPHCDYRQDWAHAVMLDVPADPSIKLQCGQETDEAGRGTTQLPNPRMPTHARHKGASPSARQEIGGHTEPLPGPAPDTQGRADDGWQLVPMEPTQGMLSWGNQASRRRTPMADDLHAFVQQASEAADHLFKLECQRYGFFLTQRRKGQKRNTIFASPMNGACQEWTFRQGLPITLRRDGYVRWCFFTEALGVINFFAKVPYTGETLSAHRQIYRDGDKPAKLLPLVFARERAEFVVASGTTMACAGRSIEGSP